MKVALDTNTYKAFCMNQEKAVEIVRTADVLYLPFVVLAELRAGFLCGNRAFKNEQTLLKFLSRPRVQLLFADEATTHHYSQLFKQLRTQGTPIPTNDLWIAALVRQHNLTLFSDDIHFDRLPQLPRI